MSDINIDITPLFEMLMLFVVVYYGLGLLISYKILNSKRYNTTGVRTYGDAFMVALCAFVWPCVLIFIGMIEIIEASFWNKPFR